MAQSFSSTAKTFEDLLERHYLTSSNFALGFYSTVDSVRFRALAKRINALTRNECTVIDVKLRQPLPWGQWTLHRISNGNAEVEASYMPKALCEHLTLGVKACLDYAVYAKQSKYSACVQYEPPNTYLSLRVKDSPLSAVASCLRTSETVGWGVKAGADAEARALWGAGILWWKLKQSQAALRLDFKDEFLFKVHYSQQISPNLEMGSQVSSSLHQTEANIEVGARYHVDANTTLKGKLSSSGRLSLALSKLLHPRVTLLAAGEVHTSHQHLSASRFGLKLNINFTE